MSDTRTGDCPTIFNGARLISADAAQHAVGVDVVVEAPDLHVARGKITFDSPIVRTTSIRLSWCASSLKGSAYSIIWRHRPPNGCGTEAPGTPAS